MEVEVLLATYNGERFIAAFLDSLQHQTYQDWSLLISDDQSTDKTVEIIKQYASLDQRIKLVNTDKQGGVIQNFGKVLSCCTSKYAFFADQDDVWVNSKMEKSLQRLQEEENQIGEEIPLLLFTDLQVVDAQLNSIAPSFYQYRALNPLNNTSWKYLSWCSSVYGCTVLFNRSLLKKVGNIDSRVMMHDHIFAFFASFLGRVIFLDEATVLYRQHNFNEVGGIKKNLIQKIINLKKYIKKISIYINKLASQINFINEHILEDISNSNSLLFDRIKILESVRSYLLTDRILFWRECMWPFLQERLYLNLVLSSFILLLPISAEDR